MVPGARSGGKEGKTTEERSISAPPSLLRPPPPPPLQLPQPHLQCLHLLLQVSRFVGLTGAPPTPHAEHHAGAHQRGQPERHGVRVHAVVTEDQAETGQSHAHFEQPQGLPQSGGDQSEDEGDQPVANESREDPLGDKDQSVWGHLADGKPTWGKQEGFSERLQYLITSACGEVWHQIIMKTTGLNFNESVGCMLLNESHVLHI